MVAPTYFSDGTVELFLDQEGGSPVVKTEVKIGLTDVGTKDLVLSLPAISGRHNLIFRFKCQDKSKMFAGIASLEFLK
jgi:hypothetical protein